MLYILYEIEIDRHLSFSFVKQRITNNLFNSLSLCNSYFRIRMKSVPFLYSITSNFFTTLAIAIFTIIQITTPKQSLNLDYY